MISIVLALCAAVSNAVASNLQRIAARTVPESKAFRLALILDLIRRPVWLGGIVALIAGFAFQAAALSTGPLALVQPVLATELPFTMVLLSLMFKMRLEGRIWLAVATMSVGLALFLFSASPSTGREPPSTKVWILAAIVTVAVVIGLCLLARLIEGDGRAALLGVATGIGFAFTAAFMKQSTSILAEGVATLATSWQPYAMVAAGLCSLFLLQNTLQSGTLVAAQPALTISDPVASILYGTMMFGESVRTGPWIILEAIGIGSIFFGSFLLAKSPQVRAQLLAQTKPKQRS
ncbi:membrane protein [Nonomuraea cavernae]|uniref:Membrane protein n=2 Tax=Nonomuraea cavernae TaxID=2045107 RepID=A0A918DIV4_9ACTN|nr:membrane protein [Nonomuraea cavernae]